MSHRMAKPNTNNMNNQIKGMKTSNGNYVIELNGEQMTDFASLCVLEMAKWLNKSITAEDRKDKEINRKTARPANG